MINYEQIFYDVVVSPLEKQIKKLSKIRSNNNNNTSKKMLDKEIHKLDREWYKYLCKYAKIVHDSLSK